mgnify:CR=1 FL=1
MMNMFTVVGRLMYVSSDYTNLVLTCVRSYKDSKGEYLNDEFTIFLPNGIASKTAEYLKLGDVVGIKGHLESFKYTKEGKEYRQTRLLADKISFLSSKNLEEE